MKKTVPSSAVLIPDNAKLVFEGEIFSVFQWPQENFDGSVATFEMLRRPDTATALCINDGKILVLEEEQPHSGVRINLPAGRIESNDTDVLSATKREVLEETGLKFQKSKLISVNQPYFKLEWFIHLHVFYEISPEVIEPKLDAGEKIKVLWLSFEELKQMVESNTKSVSELRWIFDCTNSIEEIMNLPEFVGQIIDR